MTEETILLSNHDNEEESSNQPTLKPSNKRSKKQKSSEHIPKKVRTLEKTHKYKSIMSPLLKEIKKRIKPKNIRSQYVDIEEIADIFIEKEEEEKAECENIKNALEKRLNLNEPFNTTGMLEKVKLNLYNTMELY
ncbi:12264_t:CDS:2 [Funneliformis geosporum]|uniref:12264_t:CDS:1 n=1 Tax=Funneliformis geosporum TaxID=1117311 RepID=A0A9W4WTX1_9GLOM|nr:12264_t:CDS:2 [Funneliformis geosporum]